MKNIFYKTLPAAILIIAFASCKKDESRAYYQGGTAPVLTSSVADGSTIALQSTDAANTALSLSWTNPNYQFSNGISSLDVTYNIEFDTAGANFSSKNVQTVQISKNLSTSFTVDQLNNIITNGVGLALNVPGTFQVKIVSFLAASSLSGAGSPNSESLSSNVYTYTTTPYAPPPKVTPPREGTLYIVGSAISGGWSNPLTDSAAQKFTQISPTEYQIVIPLIGGGEYKTIAVDGSWGEQWSVKDADTYPNGGPFVANGNNSIAPGVSGTYLIDFNFQTGIFSVTPQ